MPAVNTRSSKSSSDLSASQHVVTTKSQAQNNVHELMQQVKELTAIVKRYEEKFHVMNTRIDRLEAESIIKSRVNTLLTAEIDSLQQYQRRSCLVISGMQAPANEVDDSHHLKQNIQDLLVNGMEKDEDVPANNVSKANFKDNLDKCHRVGPVKDDGTQDIIVKFRNHSFREKLYGRRKKITQKGIKFCVSLMKRRTFLLNSANDRIREKCDAWGDHRTRAPDFVKFAFADTLGNIKLFLKYSNGKIRTVKIEDDENLEAVINNLVEPNNRHQNIYDDDERYS